MPDPRPAIGNLWNREPALIVGAVQAILGLAMAFGLELSAEQVAAVLAASAGVLGLVVRRKVSPVVKVPTEPDA